MRSVPFRAVETSEITDSETPITLNSAAPAFFLLDRLLGARIAFRDVGAQPRSQGRDVETIAGHPAPQPDCLSIDSDKIPCPISRAP